MGRRVAERAHLLTASVRENLGGGPARRRRYLRGVLRAPLEAATTELLADLPQVALTELVDLDALEPVDARVAWSDRGSWSIGPAERLALECLVRGTAARTVFEIGTFNGGTTAMLAAAVGPQGRVVTMDLPPERFAATQTPADLDAGAIGARWRASPYAERVEQLAVDSVQFDPAPYAGQFDLVLVDGAHDYVHGLCDTRTARTVVRPGGLVVFDDVTPYWSGLVRGIVEAAAAGGGLARLTRTNLAVLRA